ncbi:MAG: tRNA (adenosine(37)-N6)-dimethylallyltransferase MiaA [Candidatus Kapabacteria bacterium]|nr:tRNA (adenosine(37)-N6)-dimethylallyltransferase MiaA [Candidatus Kapabacteria bacterium]
MDTTRMEQQPVIVISGPTASGKSALAMSVAEHFSLEIISADSRQVYRGLDIGTAKPTKEEQARVRHHLIDIRNPDERYSAGQFARDAKEAIDDIHSRFRIPVVVGGTGLYISALFDGIAHEEESDDLHDIRKTIEQRMQSEGRDALYEELASIDPLAAERYADKNPVRVIRALAYIAKHGIPFSTIFSEQNTPHQFNAHYFAVNPDVEILKQRINSRTEHMWADGLADETQRLLDAGYSPDVQSLNTVGYKEAIAFLRGDINRLRAIELTAQNTRRYAKRQRTWMRSRCTEYTFLTGTPHDNEQQLNTYCTELFSATLTSNTNGL